MCRANRAGLQRSLVVRVATSIGPLLEGLLSLQRVSTDRTLRVNDFTEGLPI